MYVFNMDIVRYDLDIRWIFRSLFVIIYEICVFSEWVVGVMMFFRNENIVVD